MRMWGRAKSPDDVQAVLDSFTKAVYFDWMVEKYQRIVDALARLTEVSDELKEVELTEFIRFLDFQVFSYLKFFDHRLPDQHAENFYFEREWRIVGNLHFNLDDVERVILPQEYAKRFRLDCPDYYGQLTFVG